MEDENAFGILVAFSNIEDEEYATDVLSEFVDRFTLFSRLVLQHTEAERPASQLHALSLGHAVYLEFAEDDAERPLLAWVKTLRKELSEHGFQSTVIITHGGRWASDREPSLTFGTVAQSPLATLSGPSEPLRRAFFGETASHGQTGDGDGWGPGFYLDTEAMEALNIKPKNEPTFLEVAGARFVRVSR